MLQDQSALSSSGGRLAVISPAFSIHGNPLTVPAKHVAHALLRAAFTLV
jgi:hypothetical protein